MAKSSSIISTLVLYLTPNLYSFLTNSKFSYLYLRQLNSYFETEPYTILVSPSNAKRIKHVQMRPASLCPIS